MELLDSEDLNAIEIKAKALTIEECLDFLCVDAAEVPTLDMKYARKAWRRGRASALSSAADKMFSAMGTRNGGPIALEYLRELSSTFQMEVSQASTSGGFSFQVNMTEDKNDKNEKQAVPSTTLESVK